MKRYILALFGILALGIMGLSQDVSAVSDMTATFSSGSPIASSTRLFPDCNSTCYQDYHYLIVSASPSSVPSQANIIFRNSTDLTFSLPMTNIVYSLRSGDYALAFSSGFTPSYDITFILSADMPVSGSCITPSGSITLTSNGTYDVSNYVTAVVDIPESDVPPFIQIIIDAFWEYHVYFAGAVVSLIVIFLVYRLLRGRLR